MGADSRSRKNRFPRFVLLLLVLSLGIVYSPGIPLSLSSCAYAAVTLHIEVCQPHHRISSWPGWKPGELAGNPGEERVTEVHALLGKPKNEIAFLWERRPRREVLLMVEQTPLSLVSRGYLHPWKGRFLFSAA
jgi:hypothetical protein